MQIHSLPEQQTVADSDMFALDTGTTTRRTPFSALKTAISNYAHQLTNLTSTTTVNDSDVLPIDAGSGAKKITYVNLKNKIINDAAPTYTSGDAASPTAWSSVSVITSGLSLGTLLNRVTTMIKNVRWLYGRIGTTDISALGTTITGAISAVDTKITQTPYIVFRRKSVEGTCAAGNYANFTLAPDFPADETLMAIVSVMFEGTGSSYMQASTFYLSGSGNLFVTSRNLSSSTGFSGTVYFNCLMTKAR